MATNATEDEIVGWISSGEDRGTVDVLWTCCVTIVLCVWVSTHPNVPALSDKWYDNFRDKFNMACIGLLGPDFLFGIAIGQLANAKRSVKVTKHLFNHVIFLLRTDLPPLICMIH